ncbi:MAG: hypothetical protein J5936_02405 [Acholeplasmatales bacterium]|nr:hypothetical protein [Acholeplasmatales bacterium]
MYNDILKDEVTDYVNRMFTTEVIERMSPTLEKKIFKMTVKNTPSTAIQLTQEEAKSFLSIYKDNGIENFSVANNDILIANTVPIRDMIINFEGDENLVSYRVFLFDKVHEIRYENHVYSGVGVVLNYYGGDCVFTVLTNEGEHVYPLLFGVNIQESDPVKFLKALKMSENIRALFYSMTMIISVWYGIQISLLHPVINEVVRKQLDTTKETYKHKYNPSKKKTKICYVKKIVINKEECENIIKCRGKYARHTMLWYVIGHYRTLKNGKKIFIKPHWRGPLHEAKNALNVDPREREVIPTINKD